jgi:colanic acid/amylovoran biosynthesis glycosyltransferase
MVSHDPRPTVAHCASPFLNLTMGWIYRQIEHQRRYRPVVLTQEARNLSIFPVEPVHDAAQGSAVKRLARRALLRLTGQYAFYAPLLRREDADLIHAHFGQEGYRCLNARRRADIPLVTTFYGLDVSALPRIPAWRRRFRRLFQEGARFLAEGPCLGERLVDLGCPHEKVRVQRLGVDLSALPCRPFRDPVDGCQIVLMCAYFNEKKGLPYGVRAFGRVADRHPDARLHIIGDGPRRPEIEAAVCELNLSDRVTFLGLLPASEYLPHLLRCHVLLYPSVTASDGDTEGGAPVTVLEALASGLPVVSSQHADIPAVAPDGTCALLASERDVDGLAERLDALLSDPALRGRMGEAGRRHMEEHHDAVKQGEKLERIYDEVIL